MLRIDDKSKCCGCTACASICSHAAIEMKPDALGFMYPQIDESKCVNCGLCEIICQFNDHYDLSSNYQRPIAYAARHKDIEEVMKSRSGAAFVAISDYVLENGGVVYGAGYKDHFRVAHKRASTKDERDEFRGSKYVQSDLNGIFKQVKKDLLNGLTVLFSGTPCQTSGLNSYIGKNLRPNLILVDIVCHGVPSPYIWRDYLCYQEQKTGKKAQSVDFRDKKNFGWADHRESIEPQICKGGKSFTFLFYQHILFRKSCGVCFFANYRRPSDITLADFWGWETSVPEFNKDDKGVSLLLINTPLGDNLFSQIKNKMMTQQVKLENCLQTRMQHPAKLHPMRDKFELEYRDKGFKYVFLKYGNTGLYYKIRILRSKLLSFVTKTFLGAKKLI